MSLWLSVTVIVLLFILGGVFSAAEMALVTLRESQVRSLAHKGKRGRAVQQLTSNPNRFLSAVQIGVTLAGFLSSAFGSDSLAIRWVAPMFQGWGMASGVASVLAMVLVTAVISFCSIVISELTAKRLAMQRPDAFALALAPMISAVARLCRPLIWALGKCTNGLVRLLGGDPHAAREAVSSEELRSMVTHSETLGIEERHIVDEVFDAGDRSLREVMVPRTEVDFLPGDMPAYKAIRELQGNPHSRYPVIDGSPDAVIGFLHLRDLFDLDPGSRSTPLRQMARPVLSLPATVKVLRALTDMRRAHAHLAIVVDEYGGTAGIVTLEDLVEELVGDITDEYDVLDEDTRLHRSHREIDGLLTLETFEDRTGYSLPEGPYDTVAGYVLAQFGRLPQVGDSVTVQLYPASVDPSDPGAKPAAVQFTVTEMDGRRIAWLRARWLGTDLPALMSKRATDQATQVAFEDSAARIQVAAATRPTPAKAKHADEGSDEPTSEPANPR